jgi:hypothetical protein
MMLKEAARKQRLKEKEEQGYLFPGTKHSVRSRHEHDVQFSTLLVAPSEHTEWNSGGRCPKSRSIPGLIVSDTAEQVSKMEYTG